MSNVYDFKFAITDEFTAPLRKLMEGVSKLNGLAKIADNLTINLHVTGEQGLRKATKEANTTTNALHNLQKQANQMRNMVGSYIAGSEIKNFITDITTVSAEFDKQKAILTNMTGSSATANNLLQQVDNFAIAKKLDLEKTRDSFLTLVGRGITPTMDEFLSLSDVALTSSKSINQYVEAILDGQTQEMERLKEFGIGAEKIGNKIKFTMLATGQSKVINADAKSLADYLIQVGKMKGIKGATDAVAATRAGSIQNMKNQLTILQLGAADIFSPLIDNSLLKISEGFQKITEWTTTNKATISGWVNTLGIFFGGLGSLIGEAWDKSMAFYNKNKENINTFIGDLIFLGKIIGGALIVGFKLLQDTALGIGQTFFQMYYVARTFVASLLNGILSIGNLFATLWNNFTTLIGNLFPNFTAAFIAIKDFLYNKFIQPIANWFGQLFDFKGIFDIAAPSTQSLLTPANEQGKDASGSSSKDRGKSGSLGINDKLNEVKGDSGKVINIRIDSLIKQQTIQTTNLREGSDKIREMVAQILLSAVNDVNYSN